MPLYDQRASAPIGRDRKDDAQDEIFKLRMEEQINVSVIRATKSSKGGQSRSAD